MSTSFGAESNLRFGVWAPYRGAWVIDTAREEQDASFSLSRDVVLSAERVGFDTVLFAQHTINPLDPHRETLEPWTAAAAAAALTSKIEIMAAIKPLLYHPVVLAKMALGIEDISQGRFALNVVNAWFKPELEKSGIGFPEHDSRYSYGDEWLRIVRSLISGETLNFEGRHFNVSDYTLSPRSKVRQRPMIYLGGESEPGRAMANELADCWLINGRPVEDVAPMVSDLRARSRPGKPLNFGITGFALVRETDEEAERDLAALLEVQRSSYPTRRTEMQKHIDPQAGTLRYAEKYKGKAMIGANGGTLPGLVGSYDRVAHQLARFREAGVSTFLLSFFPLIEEQELFAREIFPRVRSMTKCFA